MAQGLHKPRMRTVGQDACSPSGPATLPETQEASIYGHVLLQELRAPPGMKEQFYIMAMLTVYSR